MRPKTARHGDSLAEIGGRTPLAAFLLLGLFTSACTDISTGSEPAATPDPVEASGPGGYSPPIDPRTLCGLLPYEALASVFGSPTEETVKAQIDSAAPAVRRTVTCTQTLGPRPGGDAYSHGAAITMITFWPDVDTARKQFVIGRKHDEDSVARDNRVDDQPGVGTEAYRLVQEAGSETVVLLRTTTRHSNLEVTVDFVAATSAGGAEARSAEVLDAGATYLTSLLSTVRTAAPALPGSAPSP